MKNCERRKERDGVAFVSLDRFAYGLPDSQAREPKVIAKCACGCGKEIVEGYEYIEYDGDWFSDYECFMKFLGAEWRCAEAS